MLFTVGTQQSKEVYQGLLCLVSGMVNFILSSEQRKYHQSETITCKIREINTTISCNNENAMYFPLPSFPAPVCLPLFFTKH